MLHILTPFLTYYKKEKEKKKWDVEDVKNMGKVLSVIISTKLNVIDMHPNQNKKHLKPKHWSKVSVGLGWSILC